MAQEKGFWSRALDAAAYTGAELSEQRNRNNSARNSEKCAEHLFSGKFGQAALEFAKAVYHETVADSYQQTKNDILAEYED